MDPQHRVDVNGLAGFIADEIMQHLEHVRSENQSLEKKLEKERKRTQRHYHKANNCMQSYQKLFIASQEKQDKLASSQQAAALGEALRKRDPFDGNNNSNYRINGAYGEQSVCELNIVKNIGRSYSQLNSYRWCQR